MIKYLFPVLLLLFLQSCAHLSDFDSGADRLEQLNQYQADQEYGKALKLIADISKKDPQSPEIEKLRKKIVKELRSYEKKAIASALKQERKNEWPAAKQTYEEALQKSGSSKMLEDAQQAMLLRFQGKMDALAHEELIITGEWLQKKLALLQSLNNNDPGDLSIKWRYFRARNDAQETGKQLLHLGKKMLAENNLAMARRSILLAVKLSPEPAANAEMALLEKKLQARILKKKKDQKKISGKKDTKIIASYNKAMAYGELAEARRHLSRLTPDMQKSIAVELMQEHLQREINNYVQEELSVGNSFYRAGEYEQAIAAWKNIIELEPDNETVKRKLNRAVMIVEKLKSLEDRQAEGSGSVEMP